MNKIDYILQRRIITNRVIPKAYRMLSIKPFLDKLNQLKGIAGFIFEEYSENGKANRLYFSEQNGKKTSYEFHVCDRKQSPCVCGKRQLVAS